MSPFLKGLLSVIGAIVLLFVLALAVIAWRFDPNDFKAEIQAEVAQSSGRELRLDGPLTLSLFPWLGVQAEAVSLQNAAGFSDAQMLALERVDVRLKLLPLLSGDIELGRIVLHGLRVNLERKADGSSNWQDLGSAGEADDEPVEAQTPQESGDDRLSQISIAGLDLVDARLVWRDAGQVTQVEGLNLQTGPISPGRASDLALQVALSLADQTRLELDLTAGWEFALGGPSVALDDLRAELKASGAAVPNQEQSLSLALNARYDGGLQRLDVLDGVLGLAGQALHFNAVARELDAAMKAELDVRLKDADVTAVARQLALALPQGADAWPTLDLVLRSEAELGAMRVPMSKLDMSFGALQLSSSAQIDSLETLQGQGDVHLAPLDLHAFLRGLGIVLAGSGKPASTHLDARWRLLADGLRVEALKGVVADEPLNGTLSVKNWAAPALRADLELGGLTVAHWLPQGSGSGEADASGKDAADTPPLDEMQVPMDWARDLDLTARVSLRRLDAYGLRFANLLWTADARPGKPVVQRLSAQAYGGELALDNQIDASQAEPDIGLQLNAKAIGLGDLLNDGWGQRWVTGSTELGLNLQARGNTVGELRGGSHGDASYRLRDGSVQGVSLLDLLRGASAKLAGTSHEAGTQSTTYDEIFGQAVIESGKLKVRDLNGGGGWFKLAGEGVVDLLAGRYDLRLAPVLLDSAPVRQDRNLARLIGLAVPVSVTGPLQAPRFKVDLEELARQQAKRQLDEKKDELRDKINEKLGDFLRSR